MIIMRKESKYTNMWSDELMLIIRNSPKSSCVADSCYQQNVNENAQMKITSFELRLHSREFA